MGLPAAPTGATAAPANTSATVKWTAPAANGSPITGYVITPYIGTIAQPAQTFNSTAVTQTVTGLTNGTTYTFTVAAINGVGTGPQSAATSAITAGRPAGPDRGRRRPGRTPSATVNWTAPAANGSAITGYVITPYIGTTAQASQTFVSTAVTQVVTGLTNGTTYTFTVAAINAFGTGPQSAASAAITVGTPLAPTGVQGHPRQRGSHGQLDGPGRQRRRPSPATWSPRTSAPSPRPAQTFASTAVTQTVTGLTNGTTYTFKVAAINGIGTGPQSAATAAITAGTAAAPRPRPPPHRATPRPPSPGSPPPPTTARPSPATSSPPTSAPSPRPPRRSTRPP